MPEFNQPKCNNDHHDPDQCGNIVYRNYVIKELFQKEDKSNIALVVDPVFKNLFNPSQRPIVHHQKGNRIEANKTDKEAYQKPGLFFYERMYKDHKNYQPDELWFYSAPGYQNSKNDLFYPCRHVLIEQLQNCNYCDT